MDRYTKSIIALLFAIIIALIAYIALSHSRPTGEKPNIKDATSSPPRSASNLTRVQAREPDKTPRPPSVTLDAKWIEGVWSEDGFCEGDAGETFLVDGVWGEWKSEGYWELTGNRLVVTKTELVRDTVSGGREEINPPERSVRLILNPSKSDYFYRDAGKMIHMQRCPDY